MKRSNDVRVSWSDINEFLSDRRPPTGPLTADATTPAKMTSSYNRRCYRFGRIVRSAQSRNPRAIWIGC